MYTREQVMVKLTEHPVLRVEKLGGVPVARGELDRGRSRPASVVGILPWQESERNMVEQVRDFPVPHPPAPRPKA